MGDWSNPWKLTSVAMALVIVTALVTGVVVAKFAGTGSEQQQAAVKNEAQPAALAKEASPPPPAVRPTAPPAAKPQRTTLPTESAIAECNRVAGEARSTKDKTVEIVKDGVIGAIAGAAIGAAGGAIADGGKGAGKGAAIGGVAGAGGGTLYGLYENKKHDDAYKAAYASCMRRHGYSS